MKEEINKLKLELIVGSSANLIIHPTIFDGMKGGQILDPDLVNIVDDIHEGKETSFTLFED